MMSLSAHSTNYDQFPRQQLLIMLEREAKRRKDTNKLRDYTPYAKQTDFHNAGGSYNERLFMAGNQLGKTWAGAFECAMHLTGRYPEWWKGATFSKPTHIWASGVTSESTRDNCQRVLIGEPSREELYGTGAIPKDCLLDWSRSMGTSNFLDTVAVRFGGGGDVNSGESILQFKTYEKGRERWQGPTLDCVWFDEEPPLDIYTEGLTRTNRGQRSQFVFITFTPLLGMSDVVSRFLLENK